MGTPPSHCTSQAAVSINVSGVCIGSVQTWHSGLGDTPNIPKHTTKLDTALLARCPDSRYPYPTHRCLATGWDDEQITLDNRRPANWTL